MSLLRVYFLRRFRGTLLRLALSRRSAAISGAVLLIASVFLLIFDFNWETWLSDGFGLVIGASGVSLLIVALGG